MIIITECFKPKVNILVTCDLIVNCTLKNRLLCYQLSSDRLTTATHMITSIQEMPMLNMPSQIIYN